MTDHRIAAAHYPNLRTGLPARLVCTCKATVEAQPEPRSAAPWEPIETAWRQHRAAAGLSSRNVSAAYDWDAAGGVHRTGAGNSKKSAAERGRMGVAAKRAKGAA